MANRYDIVKPRTDAYRIQLLSNLFLPTVEIDQCCYLIIWLNAQARSRFDIG
jgi:hypothetical protein